MTAEKKPPCTAPAHLCQFDAALNSITIGKISESWLQSTHGASRHALQVFDKIAHHGTAAQQQRALGFFDLSPEEFFEADNPRSTTLHLTLMLLAALNKTDEIINLLGQIKPIAARDNRTVPFDHILRLYQLRHGTDATVALQDRLKDLRPTPIADIDLERSHLRLMTEILYADKFDDAQKLHANMRFSLARHAEASENLLLAYARRHDQGKSYYRHYCESLLKDTQDHLQDTAKMAHLVERLISAECLRHQKDIAAALDIPEIPAAAAAHRIGQARHAFDVARAQQTAHESADMLQRLERPLTGDDLESLAFLDPFIAADLCRLQKNEQCVGYVADIITRKEEFRHTPVSSTMAQGTWRIERIDLNGKGLKPAGHISAAEKNIALPRFHDEDIETFKREFGLLPALNVPAMPALPDKPGQGKSPDCTKIRADETQGLSTAACLLMSQSYICPGTNTWDARRQYLLNPYKTPKP